GRFADAALPGARRPVLAGGFPGNPTRSEEELHLDLRAVVEDAAVVLAAARRVLQVEVDLLGGDRHVEEPQRVVAAADAEPLQDVELDEPARLVQVAEDRAVPLGVEADDVVAANQGDIHLAEVGAPGALAPEAQRQPATGVDGILEADLAGDE